MKENPKEMAINAIQLSIREGRDIEIGGSWNPNLYLEFFKLADNTTGETSDGYVHKDDKFVVFDGEHDGHFWQVFMRTDGKPGADDHLLFCSQPTERAEVVNKLQSQQWTDRKEN